LRGSAESSRAEGITEILAIFANHAMFGTDIRY